MTTTSPFSQKVQHALNETLPFLATPDGGIDLRKGRGEPLFSSEAKAWRDCREFVAAPECRGSSIQRLRDVVKRLQVEDDGQSDVSEKE